MRNDIDVHSKQKGPKTQLDWIKCLKGANLDKFANEGMPSNLKRMNRTKANQIGYVVEDLDEQVLQLKEAVEAVTAYKQYFEEQIELQSAELMELNKELDNVKKFGGAEYSENLARNLQRELGLLEGEIRSKQREIEEIKNGPRYYEFVENFMLVERYKQEIERLSEIEHEILTENAELKNMDQKDLDKLIKAKTVKLKKLQDHLQDIDKEIIKIESAKKKESKRSKSNKAEAETRELQNEIEKQQKVIKQYEKDIAETETSLINCESYKAKIEKAKNENVALLQYLHLYSLIYELDNGFFYEIVESLNEVDNIEEVVMTLRKDFDIDLADRFEAKNNFANAFFDSRGFFMSDMLLSAYALVEKEANFEVTAERKNTKEVLEEQIERLLESFKSLHLYELIVTLGSPSLDTLGNIIKRYHERQGPMRSLNDSTETIRFNVNLKTMTVEKTECPNSLFSNNRLAKGLSDDRDQYGKTIAAKDKPAQIKVNLAGEDAFDDNFEGENSVNDIAEEHGDLLDDF